jgi:hypothetical protein
MTETGTYADGVDMAGIERNWPEDWQVPKLISDVANLMAPWPNGSFGYPRFKSTRFDEYWIELGGDLNEQFGIFINLPEGTNIAVWFHKGAVKGAEPIIELGSEGDLYVLAPNLKSFFAMRADCTLAKNTVSYNELIQEEGLTTPEEKAHRPIYAAPMRADVAQAPDYRPGVRPRASLNLWSSGAQQRGTRLPLIRSCNPF